MILSTISLTVLSGIVSAFESQGTLDLKILKKINNILLEIKSEKTLQFYATLIIIIY